MSVLPCNSVPVDLEDFPDDRRVNYAFGMVMGVDDFRQEQAYHVGRKKLNNRALHGYGVAYGLEVSLRESSGRHELVVAPGMAVLPGGEDVEVDEEYCLDLGPWLEDRSEEERTAGAHDDGWRFCVTLGYAECLERLVPVPGLPCATEEESRQHSRIREGFSLELEPGPVEEIEEWASRRLGHILSRVEVDDTPGAGSEESELVALVRKIAAEATPLVENDADDPWPPVDGGDSSPLWLPADRATGIFRRVYRIWTGEVRPALLARLGRAPVREDRVVLACVDFDADTDGEPDPASATLDATLRPVLVNTRALQELLLAGTRHRRRDTLRFATLHAEDPDRIRVWLHHPDPLETPPAGALDVEVNGAARTVQEVLAGPDPDLVEVRVSPDIPEDARVRVRFDALALRTAAGTTLLESMEEHGIDYVSRRGSELYAETVFQGLSPTRRFVTVRYVKPRALELWFHTEKPLGFGADVLEALRFTRETGEVTDFRLDALGPERNRRFHLQLEASEPDFEDGEHLGLRFDVEEIFHEESPSEARLGPWIRRTETEFLGWDGDRHIEVFERLAVEGPGKVKRTERFARMCVRGPDRLRLWLFAPRPLGLDGLNGHESHPLTLLVDGEEEEDYRIEAVDVDAGIFDVLTDPGPPLDRDETAIRIFFHLDRIPFEGGNRVMSELLDELDFTYLNLDGVDIREDHLHCCCDVRTCHFGTVRIVKDSAFIWLHADPRLRIPTVRVERRGGQVELNEEVAELSPPPGDDDFARLWRVRLPGGPVVRGERITMGFGVRKIFLRDERTLLAHMIEDRVRYVCWDGEDEIRIHHQIPEPPPRTPPEEPEEPEEPGHVIPWEEIRDFTAARAREALASPEAREIVEGNARSWLTSDEVKGLIQLEAGRTLASEEGAHIIDARTLTVLASEEGRSVAREAAGRLLESEEGIELIRREAANLLSSEEGKELVRSEAKDLLSSPEGKKLVRSEAETLLRSDEGRSLVRSEATRLLQTDEGSALVEERAKRWLSSPDGQELMKRSTSTWLRSDEGRELMETRARGVMDDVNVLNRLRTNLNLG